MQLILLMGKINNRENTHYKHLKRKWISRHKKVQKKLWERHGETLDWLKNSSKQLAIGSLGGLLLLTAPNTVVTSQSKTLTVKEKGYKDFNKNIFLISDLSNLLPNEVRPLSIEEEQKISNLLSRNFGFKVTAELDDKRLNRSYGLIGAEQHLARFPGDNMSTHFDTENETREFWSSGMAPGLGAWGYFVSSKDDLKRIDKLREKYYIAVQTFLAPGFNDNVREFITFFKFRKMLVINPQNGHAMVTVIGDAGPAEWTGKHLGGSPEVMRYLERVDGKGVGPVLYFFIDDPTDKIPLGPVKAL